MMPADRCFDEGNAMEFEQLVRMPRTVRGYKKQPVQRALIEEILAIAIGAPSSMNTQP